MSALAALALASCSDDEPAEDEQVTTTAPTAADRLGQAEQALLDAGSVHLLLQGTDLPESGSYIVAADGSGTLEPSAFEGTITAQLAGLQADVPTIAVDDKLYVQLPFTPGYTQTDPETLNVPDPAQLFDPESGLVSLLSETEQPEFGEQSRVGRDVVQEITGTLPGQVVSDLLMAGSPDAEFDVTYGLVEGSWQARTVTITGPFYPPAESTYTLTLDQYGEPVTVTAP